MHSRNALPMSAALEREVIGAGWELEEGEDSYKGDPNIQKSSQYFRTDAIYGLWLLLLLTHVRV